MKHTTDHSTKPLPVRTASVALVSGPIALLTLVWGIHLPGSQAQGSPPRGEIYPTATPPGNPPDAQSTTGPTPPPGVRVMGLAAPSATAIQIPGVPAYTWHHGCGPTAAGMVIGYWDGQGFDALVPGDASTQTAAVNEMIASEGSASNYTDYCVPIDYYPYLYPDLSEPPPGDEHPDECVADFMKTSQSVHQNRYGWSWFSHVETALENYVAYVNSTAGTEYAASADSLTWSGSLWDTFRAEIDAGRPVVLLVDTNADGSTDHFVTAVGYDTAGGTPMYGCHNTWDENVHWWQFAPMAPGQDWGVYGATSFHIVDLASLSEQAFLPLALRDFSTSPCVPDWPLSCGSSDSWNNSWSGATNRIGQYSCISWDESGPEYTYSFTRDTDGEVTVSLSDMSADLDVFVLDGAGATCHPDNCIAYGDAGASFNAVGGRTYYIVVDGYHGAVSNYTISVSCTP